ncbi:MAG TPA: AAA family ATPase [Gemmatimonadales bacterium]|nr:AAA family ATPase [Gemmatimonadales bacterium]
MESHTVGGALISSDTSFCEAVKLVLGSAEHRIALSAEITAPFTEISDTQIEELRRVPLELVVLDLEQDPATGIKLAEFLAELHPRCQVVAAGAELPPDLLLKGMRAGITEYLLKPVTPEALHAGVQRVIRRLGWTPAAEPRQAGRLFTLFSPKGGCGSTTVATNLACVLHRLTCKKTLLVDLDLEFGETALQLGMEPKFSVLDVLRNFHRMDAGLLASFVERHESGVHLLSAPYHLDRGAVVAEDQIHITLRLLKEHYDYVVVDTSGSFVPSTLAAFAEADRIFAVTNLNLPSLRNLQRCLPFLEQTVGKAAKDRIQIIVNRYTGDDVIGLNDVQETLGVPVYRTLSNDYVAVSRAINSGKPVVLNGKSKYARDLQALGTELVGVQRAAQAARNGRSLLDTLWRRLRQPLEAASAR